MLHVRSLPETLRVHGLQGSEAAGAEESPTKENFVTLPANFPLHAGHAREQAILAEIAPGGSASWAWSPITSQAKGHTAIFQILTDGIKIGGVRMSGSANFAQAVADKLGALLQTPKINDLAWQQASVRIQPANLYPPDDSTTQLVHESAVIDKMKGNRTGLTASVGKPWVLSNKMSLARATLYGWQLSSPLPGVPSYKGVTPGLPVVQPLSTAHVPTYEDYSSLLQLVHRRCVIDGKPADLAQVLRDPELAWLASHDGVCPIRQPGVPVQPPFEMQSLPSSAPSSLVATATGGFFRVIRPTSGRSVLVCPSRPDIDDSPKTHVVDIALQFGSLPLASLLGAWIATKAGNPVFMGRWSMTNKGA